MFGTGRASTVRSTHRCRRECTGRSSSITTLIGRAAVEAELARGPARTLGYFDITPDPAEPADVLGDEPIWHGGAVVGWGTSGAYAHYSRRSLAFGYVPSELAVPGAMFEVEIIGWRRPARLLPEPVLDPAAIACASDGDAILTSNDEPSCWTGGRLPRAERRRRSVTAASCPRTGCVGQRAGASLRQQGRTGGRRIAAGR